MNVPEALDQLGGYATRGELIAMGCWPDVIDMALHYRKILRVRRGQYASVGMSKLVLRALRVGGRLACVSAIEFHEGRDQLERPDRPGPSERPDRPVHVLVPYGSSRLGGDSSGRGWPSYPPVIHWTRRQVEGSRTVVSEQAARSQAERCGAALTQAGQLP